MRLLLFIAAIVALCAVAGWITFSNDSDRSSVNIETDVIREDTGEVLRRGSELVGDVKGDIAEEASSEPVADEP
jgi:hypothetical protein